MILHATQVFKVFTKNKTNVFAKEDANFKLNLPKVFYILTGQSHFVQKTTFNRLQVKSRMGLASRGLATYALLMVDKTFNENKSKKQIS